MTTTKHSDPKVQSVDPRRLSESEAIKYTEDMADGALDRVAAASTLARNKAGPMLGQIIDRAQHGAEELGQDVLRANDVARAYVIGHPMRSLLIAAGGGIVVAAALRLLRARVAH